MHISYAQNYEDILIARLFSDKPTGFYVDIGAGHPRKDSVTKYFYDRGWSGVNVEPNQAYLNLLGKQRRRDTNIWGAVSESDGEVDYFFVKEDPKISYIGECQNPAAYEGLTVEKKLIPSKTMNTIFSEYASQPVDFLKIDVEGAEEMVLKSLDFQRFRPRLIVVESVGIKGRELMKDKWESYLLDADYKDVYFDGTNSYFVKKADTQAAEIFSVPLNADDQFIRYEYLRPKFLISQLFKSLF